MKWLPIAIGTFAILGSGLAWRQAIAPPPIVRTEAVGEPFASEIARWQLDSATAAALVEGGATVLDARALRLPSLGRNPLPQAIAVDWRKFSDPSAPEARGRLHPDDRILREKLQALGISAARPVVVVGNPKRGWGEDGRIVWMLRTLGHERAVFVDGGYRALVRALSGKTAAPPPTLPGDFTVRRQPQWSIEKEELQQLLAAEKVTVLDARSPAEFAGATPHHERRGGHIPGAKSLHFRTAIGADGRVRQELVARLQALGISPGDTIVAYCTGGVRSAWLTAVLVDLGYDARNYAGSMWEWSASDPAAFPLEKSP